MARHVGKNYVKQPGAQEKKGVVRSLTTWKTASHLLSIQTACLCLPSKALTTGQDLYPLDPPILSDAASSLNIGRSLRSLILDTSVSLFSHLRQQKRRHEAKRKHLYNKMEKRRRREKIRTFLPVVPSLQMHRSQEAASPPGWDQLGQGCKETLSNQGLISKGYYFTLLPRQCN